MQVQDYRRIVAGMEETGKKRAEPALAAETRRFKRGDVDIDIDIREHFGGRHKGRLIDLSQSGCRIWCPVLIMEDRIIAITVPTFAPLEAEVVWKIGDEYGCSFHNGLHEAIYDHLIAKYPALRGDQ